MIKLEQFETTKDDGFKHYIETLMKANSHLLNVLKVENENVQQSFNDLCKYFGENDSQLVNSQLFFSMLTEFMLKFEV